MSKDTERVDLPTWMRRGSEVLVALRSVSGGGSFPVSLQVFFIEAGNLVAVHKHERKAVVGDQV